jgi:hypothetical protein
MKVTIKKFGVNMDIKSRGIELEVKNGTRHLGDLVVTMTKVVWCPRRTQPAGGKVLVWPKFIEMMERYGRRAR